MVTDTSRLRAAIFERSGIAVDEHDPIMAVLAASAQQAEEIGARLLKRTEPVRVVAATAIAALVFAALGASAAYYVAQRHFESGRAEWLREQADPQRAALIASDEGRAALRLAELGVASILLNCNGRRSWRIRDGYCIPVRPDGGPDGFRLAREDSVRRGK